MSEAAPAKRCVREDCGALLSGQQRLFCSARCRKREHDKRRYGRKEAELYCPHCAHCRLKEALARAGWAVRAREELRLSQERSRLGLERLAWMLARLAEDWRLEA